MTRPPYRDPPSVAAHVAQVLTGRPTIVGDRFEDTQYIPTYTFLEIRSLPCSKEEKLYAEHEHWTRALDDRNSLQTAINTVHEEQGALPELPLDALDFRFMMANPLDPNLMTEYPKFPQKLLEWFAPGAVRHWLLQWEGDSRIAAWVATAFRDWVASMDESLDPECEGDARILSMCN